jgi:hypothetical protein
MAGSEGANFLWPHRLADVGRRIRVLGERLSALLAFEEQDELGQMTYVTKSDAKKVENDEIHDGKVHRCKRISLRSRYS